MARKGKEWNGNGWKEINKDLGIQNILRKTQNSFSNLPHTTPRNHSCKGKVVNGLKNLIMSRS